MATHINFILPERHVMVTTVGLDRVPGFDPGSGGVPAEKQNSLHLITRDSVFHQFDFSDSHYSTVGEKVGSRYV